MSQKHNDQYMMYEFKVKPCPRLDHHNWKHCPHRHPGEVAAQRRHPSLHKPAFCMNLKLYGSCAAGDDCPFSHNTFEMSLHPERYKTTLCTLGDKCNREICFFAHSNDDLRTPDVTAPLGAPGTETTIALQQLQLAEGVATTASLSDSIAPIETSGLMQQRQQLQPAPQQDDLQSLLLQVEHKLQLDPASQNQQQMLQQNQQALLLAQAQAQAQAQQQQQQVRDLALAQQQLLLAGAGHPQAASIGGGPAGHSMLNAGFAGPLQQQRVGPISSLQQQQMMSVMLQDAAHRQESFTSQCSSASFMSGIGALRGVTGSHPVSPLIDRSAQSFTVTDRSNTGSFSTLGSGPERPHSFSIGDRNQHAALLATLGQRPSSFTVVDAPNGSITLGQQSSAFGVERSSASFSVIEGTGGLPAMMDGGLVVERSAQSQRSFTAGQHSQLPQNAVAWCDRDLTTVLGASAVGSGQDNNSAAVYQLMSRTTQQQDQPQRQARPRSGLTSLWPFL